MFAPIYPDIQKKHIYEKSSRFIKVLVMVIAHFDFRITHPEHPPEEDLNSVISQILGVAPSESGRYSWDLWVVQKDDEYIDFITTFLDILEGKYEELEKIGIHRNDIVFFATYEFYGQCNTEFEPEKLARLGLNVITLCISCWENPALDDSNSGSDNATSQ